MRIKSGRGPAGPGWSGPGKAWQGKDTLASAETANLTLRRNMHEATRYPIDFDAYNKGDYIPVHVLEQALGLHKQDDPEEFRLRCLDIRSGLQESFAARGAAIVAIRLRKDGIHILTDEAAVQYWAMRAAKARRDVAHAFYGQQCVDKDKLSDSASREHRKSLRRMERDLWALKNSERLLKAEAEARAPKPKELGNEKEAT